MRLLILSLMIIAAGSVYFPYTHQEAKLVLKQSSLHIEMMHTSGMMLNREEPEKKFRFHSQDVSYDEAQDLTQFQPYYFMGADAGNGFTGNSKQATLHGNQFELTQAVTLQQASASHETRTLTTDKLIMDIQQHTLNSPGALRVVDNKQLIEADSLTGNYEEGSYEFTHHVQSHWQ
jgi:LPS export ABC transporter protein LptC